MFFVFDLDCSDVAEVRQGWIASYLNRFDNVAVLSICFQIHILYWLSRKILELPNPLTLLVDILVFFHCLNNSFLNLGQKILDKFTKLNKTAFYVEPFTAGFSQYSSKNVKISLLGDWLGTSHQIQGIHGFS